VHVSGLFSWPIVFRFKSKTKKSAFIELTSFKSFGSEVPSFYFLSCKSASKPLNVVSGSSVICFLQPISQLGQQSSRPPLRLRLYCLYMLRMYTNIARSTEAEQRLCSEALTSEAALLQNFRAYEKWIPLSSIFERLFHICNW